VKTTIAAVVVVGILTLASYAAVALNMAILAVTTHLGR